MIDSIKGTLSTCKMEILGLVSKLRSVDSVILMITMIIFCWKKGKEHNHYHNIVINLITCRILCLTQSDFEDLAVET